MGVSAAVPPLLGAPEPTSENAAPLGRVEARPVPRGVAPRYPHGAHIVAGLVLGNGSLALVLAMCPLLSSIDTAVSIAGVVTLAVTIVVGVRVGPFLFDVLTVMTIVGGLVLGSSSPAATRMHDDSCPVLVADDLILIVGAQVMWATVWCWLWWRARREARAR